MPTPAESGTPPTAWHTVGAADATARLHVDAATGLDSAEAERRLQTHGRNALAETTQRSALALFVDQFRDFMIVVLIVAGIVAGLVGEPLDAAAIAVIVLLNGVIGFVQALRAQHALAALKRLAATGAQVLRDGSRGPLEAAALVPGDIVLLEAGNVVPADLRLLQAAQLRIDESALTGESVASAKDVDATVAADAGVGDRHNCVFKGTLVSQGRATGVVVATGMATELGSIAGLLDPGGAQKTPLQKRLAGFGRRLALVVIVICVAIFAAGVLRGEPPLLMLLTAVSLAVAAIPEALPAVVTMLLALGARKLVRQHALIRRLPAVETLGSVTVICSDKTGTLTQNRMQVIELHAAGRSLRTDAATDAATGIAEMHWRPLLEALALNNDATTELGDPTEVALLAAAAAGGVTRDGCEAAMPRIAELPFDSARKRMTTLHRRGDAVVAFTKGAPEAVIARCDRIDGDDAPAPLDRDASLAVARAMAESGLRVLAVARRDWPSLPAIDADSGADEAIESGLALIGLVGMADPPRPEAAAAIADCRSAGIVPVMITGDHPTTARAIATQLGMLDDGAGVVSGAELAAMDDASLAERVGGIRVYARVDPAQKIRIVQALQSRGEFVAMTGDGVNDAPALQRADIGVAMGRGGTDVAREASSLVLLDDNFATIVGAVREGRRIYDNIRKFVRYTMTSNAAEILAIAAAPAFGMPIPLLPIHILWINLVTDGLPGIALAAEPADRGVMQRPPRPPAESLFAQGLWQHVVWVGLLMGGVTLATHAWALHDGNAHGQTMVFTVLTLSQMGHVLAVRSERESLSTLGLLSNRPLVGAVALTFVLQMATIYVPVLQPVFRTQPLSAAELAICLALSAVTLVAVEAEKAALRRGWRYGRRDRAAAGRGPG